MRGAALCPGSRALHEPNMPYPDRPDPTYGFGPSPAPPHQVGIGFDDHKQSIDDIIDFIKTVIRSDGRLNNLIVTPESLSTSARALIAAGGTVRGVWSEYTDYAAGDVVSFNDATYIAAIAHTSEVFASNYAAGKWLVLSAPHLPGAMAAGVVDTIASLKALSSRPELVTVEGAFAAGDGGGGHFWWDADSTATANDVSVVAPTSGESGRYKRIANVYGSDVAGAGGALVVATLAAFKALTIRPEIVLAKGKTSINDGWGGVFVWHAGDATTADNTLVVQCSAGPNGRYKRVVGDYYDRRWFPSNSAATTAQITGDKLLITSPSTDGFTSGDAYTPVAAAKTRTGLNSGHIAIGPANVDAFVGVLVDEYYQDTEQEVRGVTSIVRNTRTVADEPTLGWDFIPGDFTVTIEAGTTQYIRGNMKAVAANAHFYAPTSGSYAVKNVHLLQVSAATIEANVTVELYQGVIVNNPTGAGSITEGYGIRVSAFTKPGTSAAIKLDGTGAGGQIKWTGVSLTEDSSGKMQFDFNSQMPVYINAPTTLSVGTAGAGSALPATPAGYKREIIGGNEFVTPYYHPA